MTAADTTPAAPAPREITAGRRIINAVGVDNLSLIGALVLLVLLIGTISPLMTPHSAPAAIPAPMAIGSEPAP